MTSIVRIKNIDRKLCHYSTLTIVTPACHHKDVIIFIVVIYAAHLQRVMKAIEHLFRTGMIGMINYLPCDY